MKRMKKIVSVLLAMAMVLGMSLTVFATESGENATSNVPSVADGENDGQEAPAANGPTTVTHTYEIYQIFTGDYADGVLSNIKWGANGTGTVGAKVDATVLDALEAVNGKDIPDTQKLAVINSYVNLESAPI